MANKACKKCRALYTGSKCPQCEATEFSDMSKGRIDVLDPEKSELAKKLGLKKKGSFAIKLR